MKKDIIWNSLGTSAWSFLSLFLLIIVTRINGISDSGLFSFAFAVAMIMFTISCYGGRAYQVSDHKNSFSVDSYISLRLLTSTAVIFITVIFVLVNGYDWYKSLLIFLLVGQRVFDAIADVLYGILQKKNRLYISGKSLFYKSISSLVAFLAIDLYTSNLLLSALSLPVISLLFIFFYDIPHSKKVENFSMKPRLTEIKRILKSTFLPFSIALMGLIFVNLARYFIDIYHPNLQGYFGIIAMPLSLVVLLFSFIYTPAILSLSDSYANKDFLSIRRYIGKITMITLTGTLLICVATYLFGVAFMQLLFGIEFSSYLLDIILVIIVGLAISLISLFTSIAIIARKLRTPAAIYLLSNILLSILCILLISPYGIRGAMIAFMVTSTAQAITMYAYYLYLIDGYSSSRKS